ncbi:MAG: acyl-CoA dehydrogenase family protein [Candidatus Binatia bacterium]
MAEVETFRAEVRQWLAHNAPHSIRGQATQSEGGGNWGGRNATYAPPAMKVWLERMSAKGWTAPDWPTPYGGGGLSKGEVKVLREEMTALDLPLPLVGFGLTMIGPILLQYGTEEQKREHLPKIVRGEIRWCEGFSEPGAGSDLAALQTRAIRHGDSFIVNGQKVWNSLAHLADWMFMLVRTDPAKKHEGITFLLVDMETPGVEVRPIRLISGKSTFCETFFTDVSVPVSNVMGEIDGGWTIAKTLLSHERTMSLEASGFGGRGPSLQGWVRQYVDFADGRIADEALRQRVAQYEMDNRAFKLTTTRMQHNAKAGHAPGSESAMFKIYSSELLQRRNELLLALAGPQALGWDGTGFTEEELAITRAWLFSRALSIAAGTSEVQLNIIAKRVLGLPD